MLRGASRMAASRDGACVRNFEVTWSGGRDFELAVSWSQPEAKAYSIRLELSATTRNSRRSLNSFERPCEDLDDAYKSWGGAAAPKAGLRL